MKQIFSLLFVFLALTVFSSLSNAQISVPGAPWSNNAAELAKNVPTQNMPAFDVDKLLREDQFESQYKDIPTRFGNMFDVNIGYPYAGVTEYLADGSKIWRMAVKSENAFGINLIFDKFKMPKGATLFIYDKNKTTVYGAYTDANNSPENVFSTTPTSGDVLILEYNAPPWVKEEPQINISKVVHAYKNIFHLVKGLKDYNGSGSCNRNIVCPEGDPFRDNIARSVAVIIVGGTRMCTGSLLNNTRNDGTPYFMTANHCWDASVATWVFMFQYKAPSCPNPGGDGPLTYTISGCTFLARNAASDFCLVKLSSKPPTNYNVYYTGWNRSNVPSASCVGIHHPNCDVMKISFSNLPLSPATYMSPTNPGDSSHWYVRWSVIPSTGQTAITEPGSSGSPIYDPNKRFIGQLHGGNSACGGSDLTDYYGKFSSSWLGGGTSATRCKDWLDSTGTNVYYVDGLDPNAGPLNTFNLLSPPAGTTITAIAGNPNVVTFDWDTSTAAATYKWVFGTSLPTRLISIPVTPKPFSPTLAQLDTYLAGIGLAQGDSISGSWDVWAYRNNAPLNDSLKAVNGPRTIKFKRYKPALTAFNLLTPVSGSRIETASGGSAPLISNWTKSGSGAKYKWFYASPNFSSPANIKLSILANNTGYDSLITTTTGTLDQLLSTFVNLGDSTVGQWRVYAYSGVDSIASSSTNNITFKRLPVITACLGTGTTSSNYPFTTYWMDGRTQMLFTAAEITTAGGVANAVITKIGFNVLTADPGVLNGFNVRFQHTAATSLTAFVTTGWTTAYTGTYTVPGTGLQYINMTAPYFQWNGTSNLLVEVCYHNTAWTAYSTVTSTANTGKTWGLSTDNSTGCTMTGGSAIANRPNVCFSMTSYTGVTNYSNTVPTVYSLAQNYPNPFNPTTKIKFDIPLAGFVTLKIYDVLGKEVAVLVNEFKQVGRFIVDFNASSFASGIYFYKLESNGFTDVKKMILMK